MKKIVSARFPLALLKIKIIYGIKIYSKDEERTKHEKRRQRNKQQRRARRPTMVLPFTK